MWVLRPDSIKVLKDEMTRKSLHRYFAVMENKLPSKASISKRIDAEVELEESTDPLWQVHDKKIIEFRKLQDKIDSNKIDLNNLEYPNASLLDLKIELANRILESCEFCERKCKVNRKEGEKGFCNVGYDSKISSEFLHYGEEPELVPSHTIFFCGCTFYCIHCQNYTISRQLEEGVTIAPEKLARMIEKRRKDSRNVNWVGGSPTPNLHYILKTLRECEVNVPSVWNSNMYMSIKAMKLLDGTQDVYLTDFKYGNNECGKRLSKVKNYFDICSRNHKLAFEQGELIIRHLVLPEHLVCCTRNIFEWISKNLSKDARVNVMFQYRPMFKANEYREMSRSLTSEEMHKAIELAKEKGLRNFIT